MTGGGGGAAGGSGGAADLLYAGLLDGRFTDLVQATRLWFSFPSARTVAVEAAEPGGFGLSPVCDGSDGSWIIVRAEEGSPCEAAGVPADANVILTHVDGVDVSPPAYRSVAPKRPGPVTFQAAVAAALAGATSATLTFV
ncbi:unnamed protein product [Phaeothamnion confervicola]